MTKAAPELVSARGVTVIRDGVTILHGVDLGVRPGALTVILGPNGAGKSTLLSCLCGLVEPSQGQVLLDGRPLQGWPARERARVLSGLGQAEQPDPELTSREVVLMGRAPHLGAWGLPAPADVDLAVQAMDTLGVAALADRPVGRLSGGERQRVLLARALCQGGQVLLLDEPTEALDINHALRVMTVLRGLCARGMAVVAVMHDLGLAANHADEVVILRGGRLLARGPRADALSGEALSAAFDVRLSLEHIHGQVVVVPDHPGGRR